VVSDFVDMIAATLRAPVVTLIYHRPASTILVRLLAEVLSDEGVEVIANAFDGKHLHRFCRTILWWKRSGMFPLPSAIYAKLAR
jgi:hypothetical protein